MLNETLSKPRGFDFFDVEYASRDLKIVIKLQALIELHFRQNKYREFYCQQMGLPLFTLNRLCKEYLDKTLFQLIQERLFLEAALLLRHTDLSVKEITYKLGFIDQAYFGRYIKKITGVTPGEYRKVKNHLCR